MITTISGTDRRWAGSRASNGWGDAAKFRARRSPPTLHVLLFGCLPKEEVGTDGGSKDSDYNSRCSGSGREAGPKGVKRHLTPEGTYTVNRTAGRLVEVIG